MYTIQVKITVQDVYAGEDYLIYVVRGNQGYTPLTRGEVTTLMSLFERNPSIFQDQFERPWEDDGAPLIDSKDDNKYGYPLSCDFNNIINLLSQDDQGILENFGGRVGGFNQRYTAYHNM